MAKQTKLTSNSSEADLSELLAGDTIFYIPYFQRPYKWTRKRLSVLQSDLLNIVDGETDNHFLGALIVHGRHADPSEPTVFDVIDGQQRITTIYLHVLATIRVLCDEGEVDEALALFQKYCSIGRKPKGLSNVKLHSCKEDRNQLNAVFDVLLKHVAFSEKLGSYRPAPLPKTGSPSGTLTKSFQIALRFMREQTKSAGLKRLRDIYRVMLQNVSVVQINVFDPTNGPKIFDSLNSQQEPMTIGDLVRNEIFSRVSDLSSDDVDTIDETYWQPFYQRFKVQGRNLFDSYFFPFGLISNPNLAKSEIYGNLREQWDSVKNPADIIADLTRFQTDFIDIVTGSNLSSHSEAIYIIIRNLSKSNAPASTYPFLMKLSRETRLGAVTEKNAANILKYIEAFLVRRALCGIEPTGLHAVFKRLWADCDNDLTVDRVRLEVGKHKTVHAPTDAEVKKAILTRPLYGSAIVPFIIRQFDLSLGGDSPLDVPWIEHILPQTQGDGWVKVFTKETHEANVNLLGNLIPLSSRMNAGLHNSSFDIKKTAFQKDSMFKSARIIADQFSSWTAADIEKRGAELGTWACVRWPS